MTSQELLLSLGLPSWGPAAAVSGVAGASKLQIHQTSLHFPIKDVMDLRGIPHTALEHAAGNGMCVPAVAFAMLVAVLALQPKI